MSNQLICGVFGFGNVGQGVHEILKKNGPLLKQRCGYEIVIKTIVVRSPEKYADIDTGTATLSTDPNAILNDPEIDIVIELMGGEYPAYDIISDALKAKKHVVTANKEVVAKHKKHFFDLANEHNVTMYYEAAIAGAIPIIRTLKVGYAANKFYSISGIFNGTTNFILTKIHEENKPFADALKEAQDLGFAEADPTMDVNGMDAAYKLVILAAVAFKADVSVDDFLCEGIEHIDLKDVAYGKQLGYTIKLLASACSGPDGSCALMVMPTMLPNDHPLASVRNEFNAIAITGNAMDDAMLYGKGAGPEPTGSAVLSDVISIAFDRDAGNSDLSRRHVDPNLKKVPLIAAEDTIASFYIRLTVKDEKGVLEQLSNQLSELDISVSNIRQDKADNNCASLVIVTHDILAKQSKTLKTRLLENPSVVSWDACYRVGLSKAS